MPEPEYDFVTNFVCLTIRFKNPLRPYLTGGVDNVSSDDTLNPAVAATYALIRKNPGIQRKELVARTGLIAFTISRHIAVLIDKKLVEHRGSKRTGGYYPL